ncbi:beta-propeller domain-containing protein [Conexibacter sp. JD483]|uniref:beta-propeller domain-containing protein n=1 Tax=unclassified Conexibacter TaxID=2627773 RepID=UPI00271618F5|nr:MULTISPECIES: beta-propeller domain-containing protein [unclassified Conexibacter]MDO8188073.1 beta-propeller domain-containing protein [Conexibacter sp. CPCC 205706]MDO8196931.1 beta-propeller domain-containing protein [Conexibacter sp. CPCC 205762]MDR9370060.1 beta-propeller domain-containing protein [Conexibacter sp. JD483]
MTTNGRTARAGAALALALTGAALASAGPAAAAPDPATTLTSFGSCEELLAWSQAHAPRPVVYDPSMPIPTVAPQAAAPDAGGGSAEGAEEPDFSTTNVQEAGVDEPDTVKTDGRRVFAIAGSRFVDVDGRSASARVLGTLRLEGWDHQLLQSGRDRVLVIARTATTPIGTPTPTPQPTTPQPLPQTAPAPAPSTRGAAAGPTTSGRARAALVPAPYGGDAQTLLTELDVSLPGRPRIVRNLRIDGSLEAARGANGLLRLVVSSYPDAISNLDERGEVAGWVPSLRVRNRRTGRVATRSVADCRQISRPATYAGLGLMTVLTIDPARSLVPIDSDALMANVGTVYATGDTLYVASSAVYDSSLPADAPANSSVSSGGSWTAVHAFETDRAGATGYRASGRVDGSLLSQWSLSAQAGVLRVASNVAADWRSGKPSESVVTTLTQRDGALVQLGRLAGLGVGERLYGVRFIGDVGYVVTFRQVDPLHTIDLSDPRSPKLLGELRIPGYSAYLHPVGEDLLLGVGADANDQGRRVGGQVSLFDVSDLKHPRRLAAAPLPGWSSTVEWDHHAFLYWPKTRLAVVPSQGLGADGTVAGAVGFRITRASGLRQAGILRSPGGDDGSGRGGDLYGYGAGTITRTLVMGRRVLAFSDAGILSADLDSFGDQRWTAFG